jgi:hypothetical protein
LFMPLRDEFERKSRDGWSDTGEVGERGIDCPGFPTLERVCQHHAPAIDALDRGGNRHGGTVPSERDPGAEPVDRGAPMVAEWRMLLIGARGTDPRQCARQASAQRQALAQCRTMLNRVVM